MSDGPLMIIHVLSMSDKSQRILWYLPPTTRLTCMEQTLYGRETFFSTKQLANLLGGSSNLLILVI